MIKKNKILIICLLTLICGFGIGVLWQRQQNDLVKIISKSDTEVKFFESKLSNGWEYFRGTAEQIDKKKLFVRTDKNLLEVNITPQSRVGTATWPPTVDNRFVWANYNSIHHYDMLDLLAVRDKNGQLEASTILVWTNLRKQKEL